MQLDNLLIELEKSDLIIPDGDGGWRVNPSAKLLYKSLGFEDVAIAQAKNVLKSRLDADICSEVIRGVKLSIPLMAANMSTVIDSEFALKIRSLGAMGVLHRAWANEEDYYREVTRMSVMSDSPWVAASVGVGPEQRKIGRNLIDRGVNILFIDIAHGWSDAVYEDAAAYKAYSEQVKVVVGNVNNLEALYDYDGVADAVKVGIGQGLACSTKNTAGATEKQFSAVLKFKEEAKRLGMPIISDGGIREPGDFSKAIGAGASAVMAGSIFAACTDSAAEWWVDPECGLRTKRIYSGMSSLAVQNEWRGGLKKGTVAEGITIKLEPSGPVEELLDAYAGALRSAITYAGAVDIKSFQNLVKFIRI
jgi:IMP dehydrogenase/GMP reductase